MELKINDIIEWSNAINVAHSNGDNKLGTVHSEIQNSWLVLPYTQGSVSVIAAYTSIMKRSLEIAGDKAV